MGQVKSVITPEQKLLLNEFKKDPFLSSHFYFTGGTALSLYYLQHRESIDLDFFSEEPFDPQTILAKINLWKDKFKLSVDYVVMENTHVFNITFPNKQTVKVDFVLYPYKRLKEGNIIDGITVDSKTDIAVNKLLVLQQRAEVKDFVDLYFLLQEFTLWDLIEGVRKKFKVNFDPFIVGSDLLKIEQFDYLPKMTKALTINEIKTFFIQKAKELGIKSIK